MLAGQEQSATANQNLLKLLKEKSNQLNHAFQHFQKEIKCVIHELMKKQITDGNKPIYINKINKLFSGYSFCVNQLEIEYLSKCERSLQINESSMSPINTNTLSTHLIHHKTEDSDSISSATSSSDSDTTHECVQCDVTCASKYHLQKHIKTVHCSNNSTSEHKHNAFIESKTLISKSFHCRICWETFENASDLTQHTAKVHSMDQKKIKVRNDNHKAIKDSNHLYKCDECNIQYSGKTVVRNLRRHNRKYHPERLRTGKYKCNICGETFSKTRCLASHQIKHRNHKDTNKKHIQKEHNESMIECNDCDETFKCKLELNRQRKAVHVIMDQNPLKCDICNKVYASKHGLKVHKWTHSDENRFECEYCTDSFKLQIYLIRHIKNVHKIDPWKCDECDKCFRKKPDLNKHIKDVHRNGTTNVNNEQSDAKAQDTETLNDASIGEKDDIKIASEFKFNLNESKIEKMLQIPIVKDLDKVCGVCNKPFDDELNDMIECNDCTKLYHCLCVDIGKDGLKLGKEWKCRLCRKNDVLFNSNNSFVTRPERRHSLFNRRL